jgi:hypothetical protein
VAVLAVLALVAFPVPVAVLSAGFEETSPETDRALAALPVALPPEKVTVILSPLTMAVVTGAEKISVRIAVPFTTLRSCVYVFDLSSETLTVGPVVKVDTVTMIVFPTATPDVVVI